ncbi:AAA family ATPase [Arcicella rosea]|uniref:Putative ATPase n=1 Tax=Arcicella rosea TaxID=502909 RepID=A0A841EF18_9BACT|nr:ATP-binding protein [Arcicella rosea]MBB6001586.1 putative ATPase [Arcicella rosea]
MVKEVRIQNYKSVQDLTLELGRVNILIGANGCGKSNILEAIAFGSAAAENKLGKEFLSARGIRVTEPVLMRSGFIKDTLQDKIIIELSLNDKVIVFHLTNENQVFSEWASHILTRDRIVKDMSYSEVTILEKEIEAQFKIINTLEGLLKKGEIDELWGKQEIASYKMRIHKLTNDFVKEKIKLKEKVVDFESFLIYAPENTFLRKFEEESQIEPLGIRGEGLFKLLSVMSQETPEEFQEIIENLELIDWFEGFEIPKDLVFTERRIRIKDRFLEEGLQYFDQRSANEGFLFLMFYFALFISKYTPKFFAIDNIDTSLNPKLCSELIKILSKLAKKHDKQVIFTTHNPAVLDGLNLNDDEQRLLVVSRNKDGHTKTKRVLPIATPEGEIPVRLSEQFMRGYIGGLPKNF